MHEAAGVLCRDGVVVIWCCDRGWAIVRDVDGDLEVFGCTTGAGP